MKDICIARVEIAVTEAEKADIRLIQAERQVARIELMVVDCGFMLPARIYYHNLKPENITVNGGEYSK
jgi:hypothetical protein